jgi:hypothetical protein
MHAGAVMPRVYVPLAYALFPAETTGRMPHWRAFAKAVARGCVGHVPFVNVLFWMLRFIARIVQPAALRATSWSTARVIASAVQEPPVKMSIAMIFVPGATAATMPATFVPCPLSSW